MTDNNSCYSLGNAVYGVYSNSACTTKVKVGTLTTGTNGVSNPISVNEGTYYRSTIDPDREKKIFKMYVSIPEEEEERLTAKEKVGHLRFE